MPTKRQPWWRRPVTLIVTAGALFGAAVSIAHGWPLLEPFFPAHRGYVVEQVGQLTPTVNQLLIWQTEDTISKVDQDRAAWEIKLPNESDAQTRGMIQRQIEGLKQKHDELDQRARKLRGN